MKQIPNFYITRGDGKNYGKFDRVGTVNVNEGLRYPRSVIKISNDNHGSLHPTQKPVALFEYLIKTYTNEGDFYITRDGDNWVYVSPFGRTVCTSLNEAIGLLY